MNELWTEKYRPKRLIDVVGNDVVTSQLKDLINSETIPHILLAGEPGTGKTTISYVIINELGISSSDVLEINASDERGIDTVRNRIKSFARIAPLGKHRIIILDEADFITEEAQHSLRRVMEQYSQNCRFILTCNYLSKIAKPIRSRCRVFELERLSDDNLKYLIMKIASKETIQIENDKLERLVSISNGDARTAITLFQSGVKNNKFEYVVPEAGNLKGFIEFIKIRKIPDARMEMNRFLQTMRPKDFLSLIFDYMIDNQKDLPTGPNKLEFFILLAKYDERLSYSDNPKIQMVALVIELAKLFPEN